MRSTSWSPATRATPTRSDSGSCCTNPSRGAHDRRTPILVVLGGGYGGINGAKALDDVADVTLVDPTEAFVHNVAAWRTLVEPEWLDRIFIPYAYLLAHGRFVRDRAVEVDGHRVTLASGDVLEPDYLVLATGSSYPFPAKTEEPDIASARSRLRDAHEALLAADRALIVGAGSAGLELAGEIKAFLPQKEVTIADVSPDILAGPYRAAAHVGRPARRSIAHNRAEGRVDRKQGALLRQALNLAW